MTQRDVDASVEAGVIETKMAVSMVADPDTFGHSAS